MVDPLERDSNAEVRPVHPLIASDKVEGTRVYRRDGEKIGHIERLMIDKQTGKVAYAVMSFGGFMGMGQDRYPLPWALLTFNEKFGGYEVNISDAQLEAAPKYSQSESWDWGDRRRADIVDAFYRVPPYWGI
ncbi:MAG: PRC-barrel domain-containing protein [Pseudorhodoplanes sp.]